MEQVRADDWVIDAHILQDRSRRAQLIDVPSAADLIRLVAEAAADVDRMARMRMALIQSEDQPHYFRFEAKIPIPQLLFDQLFNGRSGYRAQYYISAAQGAAFNRKIVDALAPAALDACRCRIFTEARSAIARSLAGTYSKIWVVGNGAAFLEAPPALMPARWKHYWEGNEKSLGLRLPCPPPPQLDLKGTFVRVETDEEWVYEERKIRTRKSSTRAGPDRCIRAIVPPGSHLRAP
jgi:hypothetical protein